MVIEEKEDSVLILYHSKNPKYKMLVVADGMEKGQNGQFASMEIVKQITKWFESLLAKYIRENNKEILLNALVRN